MHSGLSLFDSNYGNESPTQEPPMNILKLQVKYWEYDSSIKSQNK